MLTGYGKRERERERAFKDNMMTIPALLRQKLAFPAEDSAVSSSCLKRTAQHRETMILVRIPARSPSYSS